MLSAGYGGVPSTFSTRAGGNEAEITGIKNVLGYNLASVAVRRLERAAAPERYRH
jgi:hypothetical protein